MKTIICYKFTNKSNKDLTLVQFIIENPDLINLYNELYAFSHSGPSRSYTQLELIYSAKENDIVFPANSSKNYTFNDKDKTLINIVLYCTLRYNEESENFKWELRSR